MRADALRVPEMVVTERLRLRPPSLGDAPAVFDGYAADPEVTRFLSWRPHRRLEETAAFLAEAEAAWVGEGGHRPWVIESREDGPLMGMIGGTVGEHGALVGYVLARPFWGQGYAAEALAAVTAVFFTLPVVYRVWAVCDPDNGASSRVLAKAGFQKEGVLRRWITLPAFAETGPRDCECWARTRDDLEEARP